MPNGGSQKRRPEPLPSPPPVKRRPLRSNAEEPSPVVMVEPPAEVKGKYFTKDFGAYGIFIGTCIGVRLGAHKHTGKDLFCVQYNDGDAEEMSLQALERLIQHGAVDISGKLPAKLARDLRTLKVHLAKPLPDSYFLDIPVPLSPASSETDSGVSVASVKSAPASHKKAAAAATPAKGTPAATKPPSTPTPRRAAQGAAAVEASRAATPRSRRMSSSSPPPSEPSTPPPAGRATDGGTPAWADTFSTPYATTPMAKTPKNLPQLVTTVNSAWDTDRPSLVEAVAAKRMAGGGAEYQVKWAGDRRGREKFTWLPVALVHPQLVADYERRQAAAGIATPAAVAATAAHAPAIAERYREVLAFMEPPAWAATSKNVAGLTDRQLADFPLGQFLDVYMFHTLECFDQFQRQIRSAEQRAAAAEAALQERLKRELHEVD